LAPASQLRPRHQLRRSLLAHLELVACGVAFLEAVAVELAVAWFIHRKGVNLTGDEPSYIIQAQAYLHLSPNVLSTIKADLGAHSLTAYPVGAPVSAVASFSGPRGMISVFEPGLGVLLIPFVAVGRIFLGATVGMVMLNSAGLIYLHRRVSHLAALGRRCQLLLGLMFVAPALLLAVTQIYPDLLSGVLLACVIVEIVAIELRAATSRFGLVVATLSAAYLPWLQIKNLVPALVVVVALVVVRHRAHHGGRTTATISVLCLVSWGLLVAYNLRYFGHVLGLPEPAPRLDQNGLEYTLGLLLDRSQGLFVQVPVAVMGLVGLWMTRKRLPIAVIATVLSVGSILVLNGTYTANPYGGASLAGRFMWTGLPVLLAWTGAVLARSQQVRGPTRWPMIAVGGLWLYQGIPILIGSHGYYNLLNPRPPWDPAAWPGWWPGLNGVLPQFDRPGHSLGAPAVALVVVLALAAIFAVVGSQSTRATFSTRAQVAIGVLAGLVVVALVVVQPLTPTTTLSFDGTELGTPVIGPAQPAVSPLVDLQGVLPGTYVLRLSYRLEGERASGSMIATCDASSGRASDSVIARLHSGRQSTSTSIRCQNSGALATQFKVGDRSELFVNRLQLRIA
jgi:hypothetical protein